MRKFSHTVQLSAHQQRQDGHSYTEPMSRESWLLVVVVVVVVVLLLLLLLLLNFLLLLLLLLSPLSKSCPSHSVASSCGPNAQQGDGHAF